MAKVRLDDARVAYLADRASNGLAKATIRNDNTCLTRFIRVTGNLYTDTVENTPHLTRYFSEAGTTRNPNSLQIDYQVLRDFFRWCINNNQINGKHVSPMEARRKPKGRVERPWRGLPVQQIREVCEAAWDTHPRDGMLVAQACFLLGRATELTKLRWINIDLDNGWVYYFRYKTNKQDTMPISTELRRYYEKWKAYYVEQCGPLQPDWFVIPRRSRPPMRMQLVDGKMVSRSFSAESRLMPDTELIEPWLQAKKALDKIGFPLRDPVTGKSMREGMHTFRRSGAKAWYHQLVAEGDPNPLLKVQSLLGHANEDTTRIYIGEEVDRIARNDRVRGREMFPGLFADNVVTLHPVASGSEAG